MAHAIQWFANLDAASKQAEREGKHVLLDFYNPQ
jgi:hypothetical protein